MRSAANIIWTTSLAVMWTHGLPAGPSSRVAGRRSVRYVADGLRHTPTLVSGCPITSDLTTSLAVMWTHGLPAGPSSRVAGRRSVRYVADGLRHTPTLVSGCPIT